MNGVLLIDKPAGMTSHDVVARVRRIIGERRVGHAGTLDPFATGLLVILIGGATRLAQFLSGADKEYEAVIRLGYATDTGDLTGRRIDQDAQPNPLELTADEIEAAMASLRGDIEQVPPMYSAKKIAGRKLYEHARRGEEVERQPVRAKIHELKIVRRNGGLLAASENGCADLRVRVVCSAGTYVRTLAEDLGKKLGLGAHLTELRRTRSGKFAIETAISLSELADLAASRSLDQVMISPNDAVLHLPWVELDAEQTRRTAQGNDVHANGPANAWRHGESIRLVHQGELIAVGRFDSQRLTIHPAVVLTNA
jgi:tRNA pseudouridine55 synthase